MTYSPSDRPLFLVLLLMMPDQQVGNTREEDKTSGADPVARMLLCQSDDCSINSGAAAATTATTQEGGRGKDDDIVVSSPGGDSSGSVSPPAAGVADVGVFSPHAFELAAADADGGGAAASMFRSTAKGSRLDAPIKLGGLFSLGSRGAGLGDATAVSRTRLFKPVACRLP